MVGTPPDWKISTLRWIAWLVLCLGLAFEIFIVRDAGISVATRITAERAIQQQAAGQSTDTFRLDSVIDFVWRAAIFIAAIAAVALTVWFDYYLRAGEKKGRLLRRIGLLAGIEVGIYALAMLAQIALV